MKRILLILLFTALIGGFSLGSYAMAQSKLPAQTSIGSHRVGGSFHQAAVGIAKVLSSYTSVKVVVKPYSGPGTYMALLNNGEIDMGLPNSLDTKYAFEGNPLLYKERMVNERLLLPGGFNIGLMPIVPRKDSGIKTIADLKGKRVNSNFGGNRVISLQCQAVLALGGLTWDDVIKVPCVDMKSSVKNLREGRADAGFIGDYGQATTLELVEAVPLQALDYVAAKPEYQKRFNDLLPGFKIFTIEPVMWLKKPTTVLGYRVNFLANAQFSEEAAYVFVDTIYKHYKELNGLANMLKLWNPDVFFDPEPSVPYHKGTVRYYKEKGLWTDEVEKRQQELLAKAK